MDLPAGKLRAAGAALVMLLLALTGCGGDRVETNEQAPLTDLTPPASTSAGMLAAGTMIEIGLDRALSTARDGVGTEFTATLGIAVTADGREIFPAGTRAKGHVSTSHPAGTGARAALGITLDSVEYGGKTIPVITELVSGGAGLGAILNGDPKSKKASAGSGAGGGQIEIPADTMFVFRLTAPARLSP